MAIREIRAVVELEGRPQGARGVAPAYIRANWPLLAAGCQAQRAASGPRAIGISSTFMNTHADNNTKKTHTEQGRIGRPAVMAAIGLQWLSLVLAAPGSHAQAVRDGIGLPEIAALSMLTVVIQAGFHWALAARRNWARVLFLLSCLFGLPFVQEVVTQDYLAQPWIGVATGLSVLVSLASAALLFVGSGRLMFAPAGDPRLSPPMTLKEHRSAGRA